MAEYSSSDGKLYLFEEDFSSWKICVPMPHSQTLAALGAGHCTGSITSQ